MGKRTPLYEEHLKAEGRLVDFGGWDMPVQYPAGIVAEHEAVRQRAGLFDVSHMGEVDLFGARALEFADELVANDCQALQQNQILYSPMCYEDGGIVDDLLVYRLEPGHVLLVVNAANTDKDFAWIEERRRKLFPDVEAKNISSEVAEIAFQGPKAQEVLQRLTSFDLKKILFFWVQPGVEIAGRKALYVSRTGYTGEDGFEIYLRNEDARHVWQAILEAGKPEGVLPCGLGARDSLRFEACLPLYGQELDKDHTPLQSKLKYWVHLEKPHFTGIEVLKREQEEGLKRRLVGLELKERGVARHGYPILSPEGEEIGVVTSGMPSPTLGKSIALGFVPMAYTQVGQALKVSVRGKGIAAEVVKTPFYRRSGK